MKDNNPCHAISADELRTAGAMISKAVSWERTVMSLLWQLRNNSGVSHFLQPPRILVTFDSDAAVYITAAGGIIQSATLYLAHGHNEGWLRRQVAENEKVKDKTSKQEELAAKLANMLDAVQRDFAKAVLSLDTAPDLPSMPYRYDIPIFSGGNTGAPEIFSLAEQKGFSAMADMAEKYVLGNEGVINGLPVLQIGGLKTIDRKEIEAFGNIRNVLEDYKNSADKQPLSIAVFGSPGSGKSFGIKQIAGNLFSAKELASDTYNVSQFTGAEDMVKAFQWVRDIGLDGKLPLLFFDEFDSAGLDGKPLGWLKSFLAPMQDGEFYDRFGKHPIGKCILVFAGGTASTFKDFRTPADPAAFKAAKGPDFISRVKCSIDIAGPNPRMPYEKSYILRRAILLQSFLQRYRINEVDENIVRAMLYVPEYLHGARSMETIIKQSRAGGGKWSAYGLPSAEQLDLHVDSRKFFDILLLKEFEASPLGSMAKKAHTLYRSHNPSAEADVDWDELSIHYKLDNFAQVRADIEAVAACKAQAGYAGDTSKKPFTGSFDELLETLAKREHSRWMKEKKAQGWTAGVPRDDEKKIHDCLYEWDELETIHGPQKAEEIKEKDRDPFRELPEVLAAGGMCLYEKG
jgi:hypothetical protein